MIATVALSSCSGYTQASAPAGGQPSNPGAGILSPSSASLSFGNVVVGSMAMQTVSVTNTGTATVNISQAAIIGSGFTMVSGSGATSLPVGQSASLQIQFAPTSEGSDTATLTISSNASNSALGIPLSGTGTQAVLALSPGSLNFNNVSVGQSSSQGVTITNNGNSNLTFSSVAISGSGFTMSGLNPLPTISGGQNVTFSVQFTPTSTAGATGSVVFTDNAGNSPQTLTLAGSAVAAGSTLTPNPGSVNFGSVVVGTSSSPQTITLTNSGSTTITISQVSVTGSGFTTGGINAGQQIAAGGTANLSVTFAPTAAGTVPGNITVTSNATNSSLSIPLNGTGTQGGLIANPSNVNFGSLIVGANASIPVTLSNAGTAAVSISGSSITGTGFSMSTLSPETLNPGQTASFNVTFAPSASGAATGTISITSNTPGSPLKIALTGTGVTTQALLTISPTSVAFGNTNVGGTANQSVTLTNPGNATLTITTASITGSGYSMTLGPTSINAGSSLTFTVTFAPTSAGGAPGSISITSNAPGSPATIALSGTGTQGALTANPASISFGSVAVGSTSAPTSVTLSNTGTSAVSITGSSITGTGFSMSTLAAQTLNPGQTASFSVTFAPTTATSVSGSISITSNAPGSPLAITLSGTGTQAIMAMSPASLNFNNVPVGQTSTQSVTLTNSGSSNLTLNSATISGTGFTMSGLTVPMTISGGKSATFSVQFAPTSTTGATGSVVFTDNAGNSPQTLTLVGSAVASGSTLAANPGSVNFGSVVVGSNSPQTITLTNSGATTITINQVSTTGSGFSASGLSVGQTIAAGANASFSASFAPTVAGAASGTITITSTATNGTLSIALGGTGTQAQLAANPTSVSFGTITVGNSKSQTITLTNNGNATLTFSQITVAGAGFSQTGLSTSTTIAAGGNTTFNAVFTPSSATAVTGSITLTTNGTPSPLVINLSGTGSAATLLLGANPTSLSFGNVNDGSSSSLTTSVTNNGNSNVMISGVTVTGAGFSASGISNGTQLTPGQSATLTVTFAPTAPGAVSGANVAITSNATNSPLSIPLSGTGTTTQAQIAANPTSVNFGTITVGNSNSQTITLTNNGNATLTFSQITVIGTGFNQTGLSTSTTIVAGGKTTFNAVFTPSSAAAVTGSITLTTNGTPSPLVINLSGTGTTATLSLGVNPTSLSFGNVNDGSNSSLPTSITNNGNSNITISSVTVIGAGFSASGVSNGTVLTPGQSMSLTVTFAPTTPGAVSGANVSITSNATNSPTTITLSGTGTHSVLLQWTASSTAGVTYSVFRGTTKGGEGTTPYASGISGASWTDTNVTSGQSYFYTVEAVDSGGSSTASNEAQASIPTP